MAQKNLVEHKMKFTERVNKKAVDYLLNFDDKEIIDIVYDDGEQFNENNDEFDKKTYGKRIVDYLQSMKDNNYQLQAKYKYSTSLNKIKQGRIFVKGFGVQSLQYRLRGFLLKDIWYDYDMQNAHPTILLNLIKKENADIDTMYLEHYVNNRQKVLEKNYLNKVDILKSINCDKSFRTKNEFLKSFDKEVKKIQEYLYNKYGSQYPTTNKNNPKGSLVNKLLCIQENNILQKVISYCKDNNINICAPMFDGLLIDKPDLIDRFNEITLYDGIKWTIKEHDESIEIDEDILEKPKLYHNVKERFEKNYFMTKDPVIYWYEDENRSIPYKKTDFMDLTAHFKYENQLGKEFSFFNKWLEDENKRVYDRIDFVPPPIKCPPNTYNLYKGMAYEKWDITYDENTDTSLIHEHLKLLAGDEETDKIYQFYLDFLAHLIKKPGINPEVALLIKSVEGVGKNILFDNFIENVLGIDFYKPNAVIEDIIGNFVDNSTTFVSVLNEINAMDGFKQGVDDKLKKIITAKFCDRHDKGMKKMLNIRNCMRIIGFTNNENPLKISNKDRRFQIVEVRGDPKEHEYFTQLYKVITDKSVLLKFVDELKERDVPDNLSKNIIETGYKESVASVSIPSHIKFIKEFINKDKFQSDLQVSKFYEKYEKFCDKKNWTPKTMTWFGRNIPEIDGIEKKRTPKFIIYKFNREEIVDYLHKNKYICDDMLLEYKYMITEEPDNEIDNDDEI